METTIFLRTGWGVRFYSPFFGGIPEEVIKRTKKAIYDWAIDHELEDCMRDVEVSDQIISVSFIKQYKGSTEINTKNSPVYYVPLIASSLVSNIIGDLKVYGFPLKEDKIVEIIIKPICWE